MNFVRFFHWQVWRYISRHRLLTCLNILSIATGVAVFLAIQLANQSASRAFSATVDLVAGKSQLEINAPANDLPENVFPSIESNPGITAATPLVRGLVSLPDFPGEYLDVLGLDIFTDAAFRTFELTDISQKTFDITEWLGSSNSIAVTDHFAAMRHLHRGNLLRVQVNGVDHVVRIGFILKTGATNDRLAAMDIGWAQELFGMRGRLSSIQLQIDPAADRTKLIGALRSQVPADIEVAAPERRSEQIEKMLASFRLNLTAMSLVSLFVGAFLIFNTTSASVARRRREIGILRSLGTSERQIAAIFLAEAMVAVVGGTLLGLLGGTLLARGLIGSVSKTISSLYVLVTVHEVTLDWMSFLRAGVLGFVSGIFAAILPAYHAGRMPPLAALQPEIISPERECFSRGWSWAGLVLLLTAFCCGVITLGEGPAWLSFLAAFLCLAGSSCFAPAAVRALAVTVQWISHRRFVESEVAALNLRRSLGRNSITIAALASSIAMSVGVVVMIFSFRNTVQTWINQTLVADLFVTPASNEVAGPVSFLARDVISFFESNSSVAAVDTFREIELPFRDSRMAFAAIRAAGPRTFAFVQGNGAELMRRFRSERCVIVSESFGRRYNVHAGEYLALATPGGRVQLPVVALFYDYTRDQGIVFTNEGTFADLFHDDRVNSIGIYLKPGRSADLLLEDFSKRFNSRGEFASYSNRKLRSRVFEIFDQTFAVTYVLRAIAVIVAISGIFLSLTTFITERSRLFGIMRAVGAFPAQLLRIVIGEAVLVGLAASGLGVLSGIALSVILTCVVNRAFFGWTIRLELPWLALATTPLWVGISAIAAAILPAARASRLRLAEALRFE